jgi:hypothetical protein
LDTDGFIFGGDEDNCPKGDVSLKSFLFTLRNPQITRERKFPLKPERKGKAIRCGAMLL